MEPESDIWVTLAAGEQETEEVRRQKASRAALRAGAQQRNNRCKRHPECRGACI